MVVSGDRTAKLALFIEAEADACCDISQIGEAIHATVEISPDRLDLSDTEEKWMHETQDVERHFLCREGADAKLSVEDLDDPFVVAFETGLDARQLKENCLVRPKNIIMVSETYMSV